MVLYLKEFFFLQVNNKKPVDVRAYYNFSANFLISSLLVTLWIVPSNSM
nr:MAG TPA: hypothetical protein [Bacteriophage sp.]